MRAAVATLVATGVLLALATGCKKADRHAAPLGPPGGPPPMSQAERQRSDEACRAYVAAVCACAAAKPADTELAERCRLDTGLPDAIVISLQVQNNASTASRDILQAQDQVRKMVAGCIERSAQLLARGCPAPARK